MIINRLFAVTFYLSVFMFTYVDDWWRKFEPGDIYLLMFMFTCVDVVFNFGQARVPFILHTINDVVFKLMITLMDDYEDFTNYELTAKNVTVQITENKVQRSETQKSTKILLCDSNSSYYMRGYLKTLVSFLEKLSEVPSFKKSYWTAWY